MDVVRKGGGLGLWSMKRDCERRQLLDADGKPKYIKEEAGSRCGQVCHGFFAPHDVKGGSAPSSLGTALDTAHDALVKPQELCQPFTHAECGAVPSQLCDATRAAASMEMLVHTKLPVP